MIKPLMFFVILAGFFSSCYYDVEDVLYGEVACETREVPSFQDHIQPILNTSCATAACHSSTGTAPGDFSSYEGIFPAVNNNSLFNTVVANKTMPPSGPLFVCDIETIRIWIEQGANDN